jgi:cell division protein FtsB
MKLINWLQKPKIQEEKVLKSDEIFLDTIESLKETIRIQNETINSLIAKPQVIEKVIENPFNEQLKVEIEQLKSEKEFLEKKLKNLNNTEELKRVKEAYDNLLVFCFKNLNPMTPFDPSHAKDFYENLVK